MNTRPDLSAADFLTPTLVEGSGGLCVRGEGAYQPKMSLKHVLERSVSRDRGGKQTCLLT